MVKVHVSEIVMSIADSNFLWILIPIFFVGIITDKYQEEFGTSVGNAISNGALIIFTGFSWLEIITSRYNFPIEATISQMILAIFIIIYGFAIVASGFGTGRFAKTYGRIRVITFMLMFFTIIIYVPLLYNFISILLYVLIFPFYYAFISELIKILPNAERSKKEKKEMKETYSFPKNMKTRNKHIVIGHEKLREYLR